MSFVYARHLFIFRYEYLIAMGFFIFPTGVNKFGNKTFFIPSNVVSWLVKRATARMLGEYMNVVH